MMDTDSQIIPRATTNTSPMGRKDAQFSPPDSSFEKLLGPLSAPTAFCGRNPRNNIGNYMSAVKGLQKSQQQATQNGNSDGVHSPWCMESNSINRVGAEEEREARHHCSTTVVFSNSNPWNWPPCESISTDHYYSATKKQPGFLSDEESMKSSEIESEQHEWVNIRDSTFLGDGSSSSLGSLKFLDDSVRAKKKKVLRLHTRRGQENTGEKKRWEKPTKLRPTSMGVRALPREQGFALVSSLQSSNEQDDEEEDKV